MNQLGSYRTLVGAGKVDRVRRKADRIRGRRIMHLNATKSGGGVAALLESFVPLMCEVGLEAAWSELAPSDGFFNVTKKIHNALQGGSAEMGEEEWELYRNGARLVDGDDLDRSDRLILHDPQPLPIVDGDTRTPPWIWCCHLDLGQPRRPVLDRLAPRVRKANACVYSVDAYRQGIGRIERVIAPAIDPFSEKNAMLEPAEAERILDRYDIPTDLPLVVQVSRYDRAKDPLGAIEAADLARKKVDFRLVLLGNVAADDPEGAAVRSELLEKRSDRTLVIDDPGDPRLVNALQRQADVVLQKSLQEGFGLTVTEAMWKEKPVIGGAVGGICTQIVDGATGFLVSSPTHAACRIVDLLKAPDLCARMGKAARERVAQNYLMIRYLEDWLDLLLELKGGKVS